MCRTHFFQPKFDQNYLIINLIFMYLNIYPLFLSLKKFSPVRNQPPDLFTHRMVKVCLTISGEAQYRESSYNKKEILLTSGINL